MSARRPGLMTSVIPSILCAVSVAAMSLSAGARPRPSGDPVALIQQATSQISEVARAAKNETIMSGVMDFGGFSERTLKSRWVGFTVPERQRFQRSFRRLVMSIYAKRFKPGMTFRLAYRGPTVEDGPAGATVRTTIHGERAAVDVDYRFAPVDTVDGLVWRAVDIVIDGASMASTWRTQFLRILDRDGYDALISKIDKKSRPR